MSIDLIREFIGSGVVINNWKAGGKFVESGLRPVITPTGAKFSTHKVGEAFDLKFSGKYTPETLREYMKKIGCFQPGFLQRTDDEAKPFLYMTRIEWMKNMSWFHLDNSIYGSNDGSIKIIYG
jgi:hypothetical protein